MSRDPYRSSADGLAYGPPPFRASQRWDSDRLAYERDSRARDLAVRPRAIVRERSVDEIYERRGPRGGFEEDRYHADTKYYEPEREEFRAPLRRPRRESIVLEKEREVERDHFRAPSPARKERSNRPAFMRRQSSLDTFDRRPAREEYGPPARRDEYRAAPVFVREPLPIRRALPPPRRYEREIELAAPDYYDDGYRGFPERVREREIIRTRRRSRSRSRGESVSSGESEIIEESKNEFPKRGRTQMPARLVHKNAIIQLGYPFEEKGDLIIIKNALSRDNIDEVIKLSVAYRAEEKVVEPEATGEKEVIEEVVKKTTTIVSETPQAPIIVDAHPGATIVEEKRTVIESGAPGTLILRPDPRQAERDIKAEIRALEAEKEALRAERKANRELRRADRIRREGRAGSDEAESSAAPRSRRGSGELVLYEERDERRERRRESDVVAVVKDRKGPDPKALRFMLKTLS